MATQVAVDNSRAVRWFHALSDSTRLEILQLLAGGERCVCELTDALDAAQSRLSFHLKTLREAEIVTDRRDGRWVYYSLNPQTLESIQSLVGSIAAGEAEMLKPSVTRGLPMADGCCR